MMAQWHATMAIFGPICVDQAASWTCLWALSLTSDTDVALGYDWEVARGPGLGFAIVVSMVFVDAIWV